MSRLLDKLLSSKKDRASSGLYGKGIVLGLLRDPLSSERKNGNLKIWFKPTAKARMPQAVAAVLVAWIRAVRLGYNS